MQWIPFVIALRNLRAIKQYSYLVIGNLNVCFCNTKNGNLQSVPCKIVIYNQLRFALNSTFVITENSNIPTANFIFLIAEQNFQLLMKTLLMVMKEQPHKRNQCFGRKYSKT